MGRVRSRDEDSLDGVVESCVNFVGVDVNSASPALLRYVSGMNALTARRDAHDLFSLTPIRIGEMNGKLLDHPACAIGINLRVPTIPDGIQHTFKMLAGTG